MTQAFEGIKILDFTQVIAGPMATYQLALLGAEVIKVEALGTGDMCRHLLDPSEFGEQYFSPAFIGVNLNKRSIAVNLKAEGAATVLRPLIEQADVVVENFRPGVAARLGVDYETVRSLKPDVVYCSISGYGQSGPRSQQPAYDGAIQAASGLMASNGHEETGPTRTVSPIIDVTTGLMGAFAISSALHRKLATGEGQFLDVAMLDSAVTLLNPIYNVYLATGAEPELIGNQSMTKLPTANVFPTEDGYIQLSAISDAQATQLCAAMGLSALLEDPRFATTKLRAENRDDMRALLIETLKTATTEQWLSRFDDAGVPAAPVSSVAEVMADEHLLHRGLTATLPMHPSLSHGDVSSITTAFVSNVDSPQARRTAPALGEHTEEVLLAHGFDTAQIRELEEHGVVACYGSESNP